MKLRHLATVVILVLILTTVAAHSQTQGNVGLYFNPIATRVSNSIVDNSSFSFLGQNSTSNVFYGYDFGGFYDVYHSGKFAVGLGLRYSDEHADNALLRNLLFGVRFSAAPFTRPIKPYIEASFGKGTSKGQVSTVHVGKVDYAINGGMDWTVAKHVDFRMFEIGYCSLTTASSATVGAGGNIAIPASTLINFSSGLVFRF
jgi:hypothetical protein